ncbi:conserved hypothetical protein [Ricinus communis]|uniref:Secreted protein n=1 Tax=Ricinus communis TaxID=3988 RepID=B9S3R4_RICCO|nr:conserved hypothetical protein [Ricinus communis]
MSNFGSSNAFLAWRLLRELAACCDGAAVAPLTALSAPRCLCICVWSVTSRLASCISLSACSYCLCESCYASCCLCRVAHALQLLYDLAEDAGLPCLLRLPCSRELSRLADAPTVALLLWACDDLSVPLLRARAKFSLPQHGLFQRKFF